MQLRTTSLPLHEIHPPHGVLLRFIERQDPRGVMPDLMREDGFSSVDEEEWSLARWLGGGGADGPQHGLELVVPAPAAGFELLLKVLVLRPLRTSALARSAWPLLLGCATKA